MIIESFDPQSRSRQEKQPSPSELIAENLRQKYKSAHIKGIDTAHILPSLDTHEPIAICGNTHEGISQKLRALIKDGDEFFAVIDVLVVDRRFDKTRTTVDEFVVLSYCNQDSGSEPIGYLDETRDIITSQKVQSGESFIQDHLSLLRSPSGDVCVLNHSTQHSVEIFLPDEKSKTHGYSDFLEPHKVIEAEKSEFWRIDSRTPTDSLH